MAIDCKSLMIGDWVYFKTNKVYAKITEIYLTLDVEHKYMVSLNSCGNRYCVSINEIEPIPLTPEILEANGWMYVDEDRMFYGEKLEGELPWISYAAHGDNMVFRLRDFCHLQYVHELQHCLKICGINKEIIIK